MRTSLLLLFLFAFSTLVRSQEADKAEMQRFWDTNIPPISDGKVEEVVSQSLFPLEVKRRKSTFITSEQFKRKFTSYFTPYVMERFKNGSVNDIDCLQTVDGTCKLLAIVYPPSESSEEEYVFCFKPYKGQWKLGLIYEIRA